eukprot:Lithocolla_globosa_v1_NODE_646_length_3525_cov_40.886455.p2 type:complete len:263 gc:universal NODE_646_length_3525_cov_40.886455:1421-2209(+)
MRLTGQQRIHQLVHLLLELVASRGRPLGATGVHRREHAAYCTRFACTQALLVQFEELVLVFIQHSFNRVVHIAGVVLEKEGIWREGILAARGLDQKVVVTFEGSFDLFQEGLISTSGERVLLIHVGVNTLLSFHQLADFLVVEVLHWGPHDPFSHIFLLLFLQCQLDKKLLQFFIAKIDRKLLKAVILQNLKAINIQHSNGRHHFLSTRFALVLDVFVDSAHQPFEQAFVQCLCQRVASVRGLCRCQRLDDGLCATTGSDGP